MRMRLALTGLALGSALALGGAVVPAQAVEATSAEPGWHFDSKYWTTGDAACVAAGEAQDLPYKCEKMACEPTLPFVCWWGLYLWY